MALELKYLTSEREANIFSTFHWNLSVANQDGLPVIYSYLYVKHKKLTN
jgi:hypothetical protein